MTPIEKSIDSSCESTAALATPASKRAANRAFRRGGLLSVNTISTLTIIILLVVWWATTTAGLIAPLFLPSPQAVLGKFWLVATKGFMDSTLWQHLAASLGRVLCALIAAVVLAIPTGIAIGLSRIAQGVLDPLIELYRPVPPLAYLPLIVIWFGIGELSKVLLIFLAIMRQLRLRRRAAFARSRKTACAPPNLWERRVSSCCVTWCCPARSPTS